MWIATGLKELLNLNRVDSIKVVKEYLGGNFKDNNVKYAYEVKAFYQTATGSRSVNIDTFGKEEEALKFLDDIHKSLDKD